MHRIGPLTRRYGLDALIVLGGLGGALEVALRAGSPAATPAWFAAPVAGLLVLVLLGRRRLRFAVPVSVWIVGAAVSFVDPRLIASTATVYAAGMVAAFLLGNLGDAFQARVGLVAVVGGAAIIVSNSPTHETGELVFTPLLFALAWLAGFVLRTRSAEAEAAQERAAVAERERDAAARLAVAEERARIARELHDVVAHAVSVMVLQVGAVRHRLRDELGEDGEALHDVEETGRAALVEMRRLLGALDDGDGDGERAPQPSLADLGTLAGKVERAGLPVRLHVEGDAAPLPRALDLSAYRIVQEGLTNALKHARASRADVTVRYGSGRVELEIRDDGAGPAAGDGPGRGLVGIRERVKIYGGELRAGAAPGGGFVLTARLPVAEDGR